MSRSFATSGPLLFLSVNGKGPGSDIEYSGNSPQTVTVQVEAASGDLPFNSLEIVQDGKVAAEWHGPDAVFQKDLKTTLRVTESSWIAARCSGPGTVHAHTNPVWIYFNGRAPFKPEAARELQTRIRAFENTKIGAEVKTVAKAAEDRLEQLLNAGAPLRPSPLQRFPVGASDAILFPPVLPRPRRLTPVTMEGTAVDKQGQPLADVMVAIRGVGTPVRTNSVGRFVLSKVDANLPLFLRLSKAGYATTNTSYLNPRTPKENLRVVLLGSGEFAKAVTRGASAIVLIHSKAPFTSPRVRMTDAEVGVTEINLQPASPVQTNDYEPNVILTAAPLGKDVVLPVFAGQVTYLLSRN